MSALFQRSTAPLQHLHSSPASLLVRCCSPPSASTPSSPSPSPCARRRWPSAWRSAHAAVEIVRLVLISGAKLAAIGCGAGLIGALAVSKLLGSMLFNVSATDPLILAGSIATMILLSLIACAVPGTARRLSQSGRRPALRISAAAGVSNPDESSFRPKPVSRERGRRSRGICCHARDLSEELRSPIPLIVSDQRKRTPKHAPPARLPERRVQSRRTRYASPSLGFSSCAISTARSLSSRKGRMRTQWPVGPVNSITFAD